MPLSPQAQALLRQGQAAQAKGQLKDAAAKYADVRTRDPKAFEGWHYGGMAALLLGQAGTAEELLAQAVALNPASTQTALGLGVARIAKGDPAGAETVLRDVTTRQPQLADAWHYLALALETQDQHALAVEARQRAVKLKPSFVEGWSTLGATLSTLGRHSEALVCFVKALQLDPKDARARMGRAMVLYKTHRVPAAAAEFSAVLARDPTQFEARSFRLMALNNLPDVPREQVLLEHQAYGRAAGAAVPTAWSNPPEPGRRLRVAFLSPDLREHSVAYFIEPLLRHLNPSEFEVLLYHDNAKVDAVSERMRAGAAVWRNFAGRIAEMVEPVIRADAPDILVDLTGHAGTNRLRMLARRLAPVQVTYLGYPNTTGVPAMDYRFVDAVTDPAPEADRFATEKLVRFAPTAWCYAPPEVAREVSVAPCSKGGGVVFGSFNNFPKVTDPWLRVWAQLLAQVAGARLLIKADGLGEPDVRQQVLERIAAAGLPLERVEVLPRTPDTATHLALYSRVDIALDTFPYHGTTTTCEALWMGVPVVTLAGDRHAARVGASLLTAAGHPEWVATTPDEYVRIARGLAGEPAVLQRIRGGLRDDLRRSVLMDHFGQAGRFAAALRACWTEWCAGQAGGS